MGITLANNAHTTLSADASSTDTVIYVEDIDSFPSLDVGDYFYLTLERTSGAMEIVKVTQINASSFNVVRGQEDTIPISFSIGSNAKLNMTVQNITDLILTGSNIDDSAYSSDWNGDVDDAPSRNAVYDKFVTVDASLATLSGLVSDTAYAGSWNAVTTIAPSKNAVYDAIEAIPATEHTWTAAQNFNWLAGGAPRVYAPTGTAAGYVLGVGTAAGDVRWAILKNATAETGANAGSDLDIFTYTDGGSVLDRAIRISRATAIVDFSYAPTVAGSALLTASAIGSTVQAYDADLTTWAGLTPSANAQSLVTAADYAAMRSLLGLVIGTNVQAYDADLTTLGAGGSSARSFLGLAIGTDVQAYDANTAKTNVSQTFTAQQYFGGSTADVVTFYRSGAAAKTRWIESTNNNAWGIRNNANTLTFDYNGTDYLTLSSVGAATFEGIVNTGGAINVTGGTLSSGNGFHAYFTSNTTRLYSLENGVAWREMFIDGAVTYLNTNSGGVVFVGEAGIVAAPAVSAETTGALTSVSRNRIVHCSGNVTLPASGMVDGDSILIDPRGTARTITRPGSHTMYIANTDSATGTTGAHNVVTAVYHGSSKWTLQGSVT